MLRCAHCHLRTRHDYPTPGPFHFFNIMRYSEKRKNDICCFLWTSKPMKLTKEDLEIHTHIHIHMVLEANKCFQFYTCITFRRFRSRKLQKYQQSVLSMGCVKLLLLINYLSCYITHNNELVFIRQASFCMLPVFTKT